MTKITHEQLSAYLDGELSDAALAEVEAAIAADASAAARLAEIRAADEHLRSAFAGALEEPVPARLEALLRAPRGPSVAAPARARLRAFPVSSRQLAALAASLVLGVMVGRGLLPSNDAAASFAVNAGGMAVASEEVGRALDRIRAGEVARVADHPLVVRLTFRDASGRYCREFQLHASTGLSCRSRDGWGLEALAATPAMAGPVGYSMAEGPGAPELDAARARVGVTEVLDTLGEASAIASGWGQAAR